MQKWYHIFSKNTGLGLYAWIMFCILPFYFVFRSSSPIEVTIGIVMIILFFGAYRFAFIKQGWTVYIFLGIEMIISVGMTLYFGYIYFSLFIAFFVGNTDRKARFVTLYVLLLVSTIAAVFTGFIMQVPDLLTQLPFIIVTLIGIILLPLTMYHTNKRKKLETELHHANERISELLVAEERQRIARDLHDTLGQKLSMIGLKSDLSGKLVEMDPSKAKKEILDIHQTARSALKELREIVSTMRSVKLRDEILRVKQMLKAAQIDFKINGDPNSLSIPLLVENVLSMCLKEAVTNVVKHSEATTCEITLTEHPDKMLIKVKDNGSGLAESFNFYKGNGLRGMRERLEFVNGDLQIESSAGTAIIIQVPKVIVQTN